jgi:hypothetical protein
MAYPAWSGLAPSPCRSRFHEFTRLPWPDSRGNRVNQQKVNAKAPKRPRTAKTAYTHSHCLTLLATLSHP